MMPGLQIRPPPVSRFLALLGFLCSLSMQSQAAETLPLPDPAAPGRLVSVGQHRLHLYCSGSGSPTVLLEAGMGGNHLDWIRVQPEVAKTTRVCSYDRAGYGWSEPGPKPRTAERISAELDALLHNAEIDGPLVLVGHSFGGMLSLYHAGRYADRVAGLVLVDSMHPKQFDRFEEAGIEVPAEPTRGIIHSSRDMITYGIPQAYKALAVELAERDSARAALFDEMRNVRLSLAQAGASTVAAGLRTEVILHGWRKWDRIYPDGRMENLWIRLQAELAERIGARRLVVATKSSHQVPLEAPELVTKMILAVIRDVRTGLH